MFKFIEVKPYRELVCYIETTEENFLKNLNIVIDNIKEKFNIDFSEDEIKELINDYYVTFKNSSGFVDYLKSYSQNKIICDFIILNKDDFNNGVLIHEINHYCIRIFERIGCDIKQKTSEPYCYLSEQLFNEITEFRTNKLKKSNEKKNTKSINRKKTRENRKKN